jgi:hypothetical protein
LIVSRIVVLFESLYSAKAQKSSHFEVGALVEARFGNGDVYFPGTVVAAHADGSYAIDYDDGDQELNVSQDLMRAVENDAADTFVATANEAEEEIHQVTSRFSVNPMRQRTSESAQRVQDTF